MPRERPPDEHPDAEAWLEQYWQFWDESLERLDEYLEEIQERPPEDHDR